MSRVDTVTLTVRIIMKAVDFDFIFLIASLIMPKTSLKAKKCKLHIYCRIDRELRENFAQNWTEDLAPGTGQCCM